MAAAAHQHGRPFDRDGSRDGAHDVVADAKGAMHEAREAVSDVVQTVSVAAGKQAARLKPRLRGWIHAVTAPLALVAAVVLVLLAPPVAGKVAAAVFGLSAVMLFGTSAVYHRGTWSPRVGAALRRLDHSNIFLIIAGTYTPLAVMLLDPRTATILLSIVWGGAVVGLLARVLWMDAPRWVYVPVYVALGWVAVAYMGQFAASGGIAVVWLVAGGGLAYTLGAIVYGTKRPDPSPRWFGFHEIFHALTVVGFACHTVAIFLATL
ncbi:hemolysin III family protein [Isoptericola variabilis]|uniref:Hly-III family protein n=1 Tax=Isoptericola variabilis (strain 225) TaxID=743718 RepID=F6FSK9_ISOV2|nr:hemolysin III family protein [Isoptericola variabilis]AEG45171.1 Hly-III family protein [Isoptericola variabilis 225]TWH31463.1 hemolysin III [Isoptericola variabilis J7]